MYVLSKRKGFRLRLLLWIVEMLIGNIGTTNPGQVRLIRLSFVVDFQHDSAAVAIGAPICLTASKLLLRS